MIRTLVFFLASPAVCYVLWQVLGAPYKAPGAYLETEPAQRYRFAPPIAHGEHKIFPIAWYQLDALVVATKDYEDALSPVDFGVAWGPLLGKDPLTHLTFQQSNRYLSFSGASELVGRDSFRYISNVHIIPADDRVRSDIETIESGDYVSLRGSLVQVFGGSRMWSSSLSRDDWGEGGCELMYVTRAIRFHPPELHEAAPISARIGETIRSRPSEGNDFDRSRFAVARTRFPLSYTLERGLEMPVDEGAIVIEKGKTIKILARVGERTQVEYEGISFWVDSGSLGIDVHDYF